MEEKQDESDAIGLACLLIGELAARNTTRSSSN